MEFRTLRVNESGSGWTTTIDRFGTNPGEEDRAASCRPLRSWSPGSALRSRRRVVLSSAQAIPDRSAMSARTQAPVGSDGLDITDAAPGVLDSEPVGTEVPRVDVQDDGKRYFAGPWNVVICYAQRDEGEHLLEGLRECPIQ
jgi:hypothetical protein